MQGLRKKDLHAVRLVTERGSRFQRVARGARAIGRPGREEPTFAEAGLPLQIAPRPCTAAGKQSTLQLLQACERAFKPIRRLEHRPQAIRFQTGDVSPMAVDAVHLHPKRAGHQA